MLFPVHDFNNDKDSPKLIKYCNEKRRKFWQGVLPLKHTSDTLYIEDLPGLIDNVVSPHALNIAPQTIYIV